MDLLLARRIEKDKDFRAKMVKLAKDYLRLGRDALAYWSNDFDVAYDILNVYSPLTKKDMDALERGNPKRYILPMTSTQIETMTTYVSQVLFGQATPNAVEGRRPQDEIPAEFVNQLLRWNSEQQPGGSYQMGYLWTKDALAINRGIFYNSWRPIFRPQMVQEDVPIPDEFDTDPTTGEQVPKTYPRTRRTNVEVGGYNHMELVSPYDWICDPALPLWRMQEMRFAGHRTVIPVTELRRRSKLSPDHPQYVLPSAVTELVEKAKKGVAQADAAVPSLPGVLPNPAEIRLSRTAYERTRALQPTGASQADKNDTGNVECWELWVRLVPRDNEIYADDVGDEPVIFQILISGGDVLLSMTESTYAHGMFPYSVAEGRPNAHFQFSPGWVFMLKGIQDYVDWLKNRHQEALSRTVGNIFVYDPSCVDVNDFMNPDKEGLLISLRPEAAGKKINEVFQQVPIKDLTENFLEEAMDFVKWSESVTAANSNMQGVTPQGDQSATEYAGTQQMSAGRMTALARLLSTQGLVPQTKQFVSNFQQFMTDAQVVKFKSSNVEDLPPSLANAYSINITRDTIEGEFDFIAHDGTLPGPDGRKVAAITRLLESVQAFPQVFQPAPGNLDPRLLIFAAAKASGVSVENFVYTPDQLQAAQGGAPGGPPGGVPAGPAGSPAMAGAPTPPPQPAAQAPGPTPQGLSAPTLPALSIPNVSAPQPKPSNT
jgi:hypothetical protein